MIKIPAEETKKNWMKCTKMIMATENSIYFRKIDAFKVEYMTNIKENAYIQIIIEEIFFKNQINTKKHLNCIPGKINI